MKTILLYFCILPIFALGQNNRQVLNFNIGWQFKNQENLASTAIVPTETGYSFNGWENINLPHTAKVEPLVLIEPWVGVSWYKKDFLTKEEWKTQKVSIEFEAVMQQADVWLNGKHLFTHYGGYLPFNVDITKELDYSKINRIVVRTDNADNAEVPPGKPIKELDFCYYSGIYRNVSLVITNSLHITDAVGYNKVASGGIHVWFPFVSKDSATVRFTTHILNESDSRKNFSLVYKLYDKSGKLILTGISGKQDLNSKNDTTILQSLHIKKPELWHPNHPTLYSLQVSVREGESVIDEYSTKIGIRKFAIDHEQYLINDEPLLLIGTNRHQEYPYIGNALSDNAQYRDAVKIKQAGYNIVRLSHYPQSPAFMNACDELGILAIAAIPGWQFVGNETFMQHSYQDARELIRRDRNHASIALWELSLNETPMSDNFMQQMVTIAKEESPNSKLITCGWINKFYDVWIPARQHAKAPDYWKKYNGETALFTGEYGDWEYFAQDAGLNQAGYAGLKGDERTSRQLRGAGEKRLLQQASNFQEAHNDNLKSPHLGDASWLMFDYNRGYSPDIESSGIMDIFRLPKFSYYFYKAQVSPLDSGIFKIEPFVKIASYWNNSSDFKNLKVYSNCNEVALYLNNTLIERKSGTKNAISGYLNFPPVVFNLNDFKSGQLKAVGYIKNKTVAQDIVNTAGQPDRIILSYDKSLKFLKADGADVVFVYATLTDKNGNTVVDSDRSIQFEVTGGGQIIGQNPVKSEAGIATILLQAGIKPQDIIMNAKGDGLLPNSLIIKTSY